MKNFVWSPAFVRTFKRLVRQNPHLRLQVEQTLQQLAEDPLNPSLRSHKLKGDLAGCWACSVDYSSRLLFKFVQNPDLNEEEILLLTIGSHDEVY